MDLNERDANFLSNKQEFAYFLDPENGDSLYKDKIEEMIRDPNNNKRLIIDLNHVHEYQPTLRRNILESPMDYIPAWEEALNDNINHSPFQSTEKERQEILIPFKIGIKGSFGSHRITPQQLMSNFVGSMVCVEGIVTKVSLIRPKVIETVHYCETTQQFTTQQYRDSTSLIGHSTGTSYPTTDINGNPLTTEFGLCSYMDYQTVYIQDMPERTEPGSMPQSIECILDNDLVDQCKPGDRIQMIGIYRALGRKNINGGQSNSKFRTVILVNNIISIGSDPKDIGGIQRSLSAAEIKNIKKQSLKNNIFELLSDSIIPSIHGHKYIKKAILLQLLGGNEVNLKNGTHIRGDINILMVGDPSCGKSQLLRGVLNIAPLAINTTGRGSSGVGLTAAVTTDKDSGMKRLEAGAMVLGDGGIVCIDEFDKMSDIDRTAIHEVMEQQTVTIAKAGIHTSLNARCSVIAAANPIYGMYDRSRKPYINIGLPDSLLSRFDLLFIVLDKIDTKLDRNISDHVLKMHLTPHNPSLEYDFFNRNNINNDGLNNYSFDYDKDVPIWSNANLKNKQFSIGFCKKYIEFAKKQYKPVLTDNACILIANKYSELREEERDQTLPITARCLETIIRLSTAHAKLRLSKKITEIDVEAALDVLHFSLTNDAKPITGDEENEDDEDENGDENDNDDEDEDGDASMVRGGRRGGRKGRRRDKDEMSEDDNDNQDVIMDDAEQNESKMMEEEISNNQPLRSRKRRYPETGPLISTQSKKRSNAPNGGLNENDLKFVTQTLSEYFRSTRTTIMQFNQLFEKVKNQLNNNQELLQNILKRLDETDKVFYMHPEIHQL